MCVGGGGGRAWSRLRLLPVFIHKFVIELWPLIDIRKYLGNKVTEFRVCELVLEYGVWGKEFNSKLVVYKQEWHYQAWLVFNHNPNVYYWMLILNFKLVYNARPGIQCQTRHSMQDGIHKYMWYSVPMLALNVKPGFQSQALYQVFNAMLIRLVFKAPFGIESQAFKFKEVCMTAFTSICGIHSKYWHSMSSLGSNPKLCI